VLTHIVMMQKVITYLVEIGLSHVREMSETLRVEHGTPLYSTIFYFLVTEVTPFRRVRKYEKCNDTGVTDILG